jgi:putative ABC transport system substrate-binding protein
MFDLRRRQFITLLGGMAAGWPLAASAQQVERMRRIGALMALAADDPEGQARIKVFEQGLNELGWSVDRNLRIDYRWAAGDTNRYRSYAAELLALAPDEATSVIPIVIASAADPVSTGLVASLAHPGGNVTGLSLQVTDLAGKRVELLREVVPGMRRLAIMANVGAPAAVLEMGEAQAAARTLGLEVITSEIQRGEDIVPAFEALNGRAEALYVSGDPLVFAHRIRINTLALAERLPTMYGPREHVDAGGLISYGPNFPALYRRAAEFVDKILRGAKPGDIPVEQPTKFDLVVNLTTAKALRLSLPPTLLARADEVIE